MLLTNHSDLLKHKWAKVTCEINGTKIDDARIQVEGAYIYICQNLRNGVSPDDEDMFWYTFWWCISHITDKYEGNNRCCTNITLIEEPKKEKTKNVKPKLTYQTIYKRSDGVEFTQGYIDGESIESLQERRKNHLSEASKITGKIREYNKLFSK